MPLGKQPIVIDNGTKSAGFAGDNSPFAVYPSVVGQPRHIGLMCTLCDGCQNFYVGEEALRRRGILTLFPHTENVIVKNYEYMEKIWHHARGDKLHIPIYDALSRAISKLNFGGLEVTWQVGARIFEEIRDSTSLREIAITLASVQDKKENIGYVTLDYAQELENMRINPLLVQEKYQLPCREEIIVGSTRFQHLELLFQPSITYKTRVEWGDVGIHKLINGSIRKFDVSIQKHLYKSIVFTGGSTLFPSFVDRLRKEISTAYTGFFW
ncbi:hypothetical protein ACH5RR_006532 [Cinchona calisaya]|uniref:Actin-related protein n=1 Tax=Cinchona calisaya TaxID=153742 RepID=A0ABD3AP95_9GENT